MTETTWEPVGSDDLKHGDKVRLTHESGDVIHGTARSSFGGDLSIDLATLVLPALSARSAVLRGYRVERPVPAWEPPTEPGIYMSAAKSDPEAHRIYMRGGKVWYTDLPAGSVSWRVVEDDDLPRDLVRFAPVTEVEEAEARGHKRAIREVQEWLRDERGLLDTPDRHLPERFPEAFEEQS